MAAPSPGCRARFRATGLHAGETKIGFEDLGRALFSWSTVKDAMSAGTVAPAVSEAYRKADEANFTGSAFQEMKARYDQLALGQPLTIKITDLQPQDTAKSGLIVTLAETALNAMVDRAEVVAGDARTALLRALAALAGSACWWRVACSCSRCG